MKTITKNAARCKKCNDVVESTDRHAFVRCECGSIAVDGGHEYLRRVGNMYNMEELSEWTGSDDEEEAP